MKKITLLLGLAFLAFSCSSDDDGSSAEDLIGEWSLSQEFIGEEEEEVSECEQLNTLVFTSETITTLIHFEEAEEGSCIVENNEEFLYTVEGDVITFEEEDGENGTANFSISGSELTIIFEDEREVEDEMGDIVRDEEGNIVTEVIVFRDIYTRVTE